MAAAVTTAPARAAVGVFAGLFLTTLSTLMFEIALTRIFSVTTWYHFAFVAISLALFGMTVGALFVHLQPQRFRPDQVERQLWRYSLLFAVSLAVCFVTQLTIPFTPRLNLAAAWSVVLTCIVASIPFVFSGVVVCLALTRFPRQVNRLYAVDLVGAAAGCVLLVVLFTFLDGPSLVIGIGALAAAASVLFATADRSTVGIALAAAAVVALGGFAALNGHLSARGNAPLRIVWSKESSDPRHSYEKWNAFSRITVDGEGAGPTFPLGVGLSPRLSPDTRVDQLQLVIDGNAATMLTRYRGDPAATDFLRYDISTLGHRLRDGADVVVIGVGGGRDILSALEFDARSVTGLEINGNILGALTGRYGEFTGRLDRDPRVRLVNDEARSYLTRTRDRFDLIQISLIDTWAASSAGAFALTENSLYTTEAWRVFLDRLRPGGVLSVSRWYETPETPVALEAYRSVALASQALKNRGVANPRNHLLMYRSPSDVGGVSAATLLVSPQPFSVAARATLAREARRLGFDPVLTPERAADARFEALAAPEGPGAAVAQFTEDVSPPTDDRPFFFQMANLSTLLGGDAFSSSPALRPVLVLGLLAFTVLGLAVTFIVLPLVLHTDRAAHRGMAPYYAFFAAIGLGFLLVEIAQLQRLTVFLGHPTYALTVVLFSLLVFSGLGSMLSELVARPARPATMLVPLVCLVATVAVMGVVTPYAIETMDDATTPARIATAVAVLMPLGLFMGMPLPIGMRAAAVRPHAPTAFLWGINGAMSVCASVFAVVLAVFFGISTAYWAGLGAYAAAAAALALAGRRQLVPRSEPKRMREGASPSMSS